MAKVTDQMVKDRTLRLGTLAIHAGQPADPSTGAVIPPIYQTTTYEQSSPGVFKGYDYSRADNPTREAYEKCVAAIEGCQYGLAFASGMAAIDTVLHLLSSGDHILCCDDLYGGTRRLFEQVYRQMGLDFTYVDFTDAELIQKNIKPNTKMFMFESPTNPLMKVIDIQRASSLAKEAGAISVVDNTFATPYFQRPGDLGTDIIIHSVSKYINGHSDVTGGVVVTDNQAHFDRMKFLQKSIGAVPSPMDCFLVMRGIKTLPIRMQRHAENAVAIASFLEGHERVERVLYPGLPSHPQHSTAVKQMKGFGGMMTFFVKGGLEEARRFLENVKIFTLAESLGGVESLIEHPAIMTHASIPAETRAELGISDTLIRLSVGLEDLEDLKADLDQALRVQ